MLACIAPGGFVAFEALLDLACTDYVELGGGGFLKIHSIHFVPFLPVGTLFSYLGYIIAKI